MNKRQNKRKKNKTSIIFAGTSKELGEGNCDSISMSKQLNIKKQAKVRVKKTPIKRRVYKNSSDEQIKPMPTFSDLEKMFDDSETNETATNPEADTRNINTSPIQIENKTSFEENISHPKTNLDKNVIGIIDITQLAVINTTESTANDTTNCEISIETIDVTKTLLPKAVNCNEVIIIDDDDIPEVTSTQEKKRKINMPEYCSDVILKTEFLDSERPQKRRKLLSSSDKSHLIKFDHEGSDSDVTVIYDIEALPKKSPLRSSSPSKRFSPLPSTSTDNATILENDKIFMQSLSDIESSFTVIEGRNGGQETQINIIEDDYLESNQNSNNSVIDVEETLQQQSSYNTDDLIVTSYDNKEMIDVDAIIAENESILTKYKSVERLPSVIEVTPRQNFNQTINKSVEILPSVIEVTPRQNFNQTINTDNVGLNSSLTIQSTSAQEYTALSTELISSTANRISRPPPTPLSTRTHHDITTHRSIVLPPNSNIQEVSMITNSEQRPSEVSSGLNCPICFENLRFRECASTICGHVFCMVCIKRALKNVRKCPTCRKALKGPGYHRLFL